MCKVSINIDEAALRELREKALQHDMSPEQLYDLVAEEIDAIYANG